MPDKPVETKDGGDKGAGPSLQPPGTQTSSVEQLTSQIEAGKQYEGADVLKLVEDALSADGREQKTRAEAAEAKNKLLETQVETVTGNVTALTNQIDLITRAQEDAEAAAIQDKPEQLTSLRVKQAQAREEIRQKGVDTEQKKTSDTLKAGQEALAKATTSLHIQLASMAAGIDPATGKPIVDAAKLEELVPDGDPGRLASAATLLKAQVAPEIDPKTGLPKVKENIPKVPGLITKPASTISAGGESRSTAEVMLDKAKGK